MICPHCKKEVSPDKAGRPIDSTLSKKHKKPVHYQRYRCPECFRYIKGEILQDPPIPS